MNKKHVLIVEDDERIAAILAKTINKRNEYEIIGIATNVTEAIDVIDCFSPHLILLDISLKDSCGLDVIKYIREDFVEQAPTIVMLTAAKDVDIIQKSIVSGVFDFILKPISFTRLNLTLQRFIDYSTKLETSQAFEQQDVDLFFQVKGSHNSDKTVHLPKGIDTLTLEKITLELNQHQDIAYTAEDMAKSIGTSRTTTRRYLEYLLSINRVKADIEYGTVGRPERRYLFL